MPTTLSNGVDTITPTLVTGYRSGRAPATRVHQIIGRSDPDVTFAPTSMRAGTLELLVEDEASAATAEQLLAAPASWSLDDPDRPTIAMSFVVSDAGQLERELEDESRDAWLIRVPYIEVAP